MTRRELKEKLNFEGITDADIMEVCEVTEEMVLSTSRKREIVECRTLCMVNLWANSNKSLSFVGSYYSRDHSTVLHSITKVVDSLDGWNDSMLTLIKKIRQRNYPMYRSFEECQLNEVQSLIILENAR
jgi:chromosomal replication initiation ATPase DnaA